MAQARLSIRKMKENARLRFEASWTYPKIASAVGVASSTVQMALRRLSPAGLSFSWP